MTPAQLVFVILGILIIWPLWRVMLARQMAIGTRFTIAAWLLFAWSILLDDEFLVVLLGLTIAAGVVGWVYTFREKGSLTTRILCTAVVALAASLVFLSWRAETG
ncbi:MAG: hypothetical protein V2A58_01140 [Planctomycetota bacterium]